MVLDLYLSVTIENEVQVFSSKSKDFHYHLKASMNLILERHIWYKLIRFIDVLLVIYFDNIIKHYFLKIV